MAMVGLSEAAKLAGKNRTTVFRAMKTGRLSFTVNDAGERRVDIAELQRVFPATVAHNGESNMPHAAVLQAQNALLERQIALLERVNDDLRQRLDASEAERRNVQAQLSMAAPPRRPRLLKWFR